MGKSTISMGHGFQFAFVDQTSRPSHPTGAAGGITGPPITSGVSNSNQLPLVMTQKKTSSHGAIVTIWKVISIFF